MTLESFYTTASQLCFTLLGLWWVVVQFRHSEWTRDPSRRLMALAVSLQFLLPGAMSLVSLLAAQTKLIWRFAFGIAGLLGVVAVVLVAVSLNSGNRRRTGVTRLVSTGLWVAGVLYAVITILAIAPELAGELVGLQPLEVEGIMLSLLVFMGVNFAWFLFMEPVIEASE